MARSAPENDLSKVWVRQLGLQYNPFDCLEASSDSHLSEYLVLQPAFVVAWEETPALLFASVGGGKTALRIYTARACWATLGQPHRFPIPYLLPIHSEYHHKPSLEDHLSGIVRAGAASLFLAFAFRPELFLNLSFRQRQLITMFLLPHLPAPLTHYVEILRDEGTALALPALLDRAYLLPDPPRRKRLIELCDALEETSSVNDSYKVPSATDRWEQFNEILFDTLHFREIYLLIDGVDGTPETNQNPVAEYDWIASLLDQSSVWTRKRIFPKYFLPLDLRSTLAERNPSRSHEFQQAELVWSTDKLAEMLRERVFAASHGEFGSLDAVSGPGLRDVETNLARSIPPLPREALTLTSRVLDEYARRVGERGGTLEQEDIHKAVEWYRNDVAWVQPVCAPVAAP